MLGGQPPKDGPPAKVAPNSSAPSSDETVLPAVDAGVPIAATPATPASVTADAGDLQDAGNGTEARTESASSAKDAIRPAKAIESPSEGAKDKGLFGMGKAGLSWSQK
jgi:hypothetical protein